MNHHVHSHRLRKVWRHGIRFMPPPYSIYSDSTNVCVSRVAPPNRKEGRKEGERHKRLSFHSAVQSMFYTLATKISISYGWRNSSKSIKRHEMVNFRNGFTLRVSTTGSSEFTTSLNQVYRPNAFMKPTAGQDLDTI